MGGAGASKFPELAPSPGWGRVIWRQGRRGMPVPPPAPSHSLVLFQCMKPSAAQASGTLMGLIVERETKECFLKMH